MGISYNPSIVTDGLVLCLDAANRRSYPGAGTIWTDLSGNGNNGTLTNGPTFSAANGGSVVFDGSNDYVLSKNNVNISGDFNATLSVWVKFLDLATQYKCICMFGGTGNMNGFGIFGNTPNSTNIAIGFYGARNAYSASLISINTWYNIVATKISGPVSSSNTKLYINGTQISLTFTTSETPNATNAVAYIGSDPANEVSNNIYVSNFLIYNRALSVNEIRQNYNATKGRYL